VDISCSTGHARNGHSYEGFRQDAVESEGDGSEHCSKKQEASMDFRRSADLVRDDDLYGMRWPEVLGSVVLAVSAAGSLT
jgi:hypothetical protein